MTNETNLILDQITKLQNHFFEMKDDVSEIRKDTTEIKTDVSLLKNDVSLLKEQISLLNERVTTLENKVSAIQFILENEFRKNISIIAENHICLNQKLNEALMIDIEKELYLVKFHMMESDILYLKNQLQYSA